MRLSVLLASSSLAALSFATLVNAQSSTENYTYDSLGRLVKVVTDGGQNDAETQSICYDEADNRTQYLANTSDGATECTATPATTPSPSPTPTPTPPPPPPPPGNNPPSTTNDYASGECLSSSTVNLTVNDTDPEGNYPLSLVSITKLSGNATASVISASSVDVVFGGTGDASTFTYTVQDSLGASSTGSLFVSTSSCGGGPLE